MPRKNKQVNKVKLEHKLYLARENPEPVFDLSDCDLQNVPAGIYSLCKVFLKQSLRLENNSIASLTGGGHLKDLHLLKQLNLSNNSFASLPDDVQVLKSLEDLNVSGNMLKTLPDNVCLLSNLRVLDVSKNRLKALPDNLGDLISLRRLDIRENKRLLCLPRSAGNLKKIELIELDGENLTYPPASVNRRGTESIVRFICEDNGIPYSPNSAETLKEETAEEGKDFEDSLFQAKIWELENIKLQKAQDFLEIERINELAQRQEREFAYASNVNRRKLLERLTEQQSLFDDKLSRVQQIKEMERFKLVEQLQEVENDADVAIQHLLTLNKEPLGQLLEQEKAEEERLLSAVNRYNETLQRDEILSAMRDILKQETEKFEAYDRNRIEDSRNVLQRKLASDVSLLAVLRDQDDHRTELVEKLIADDELQKAAVGALLERGDARSWSIVQQVKLVEAQLAALTAIEMDRKKLQVDQHLNDLAIKRSNLSVLLVDLLDRQSERRCQLLSTLETMEGSGATVQDFWLRRYQQLLDKLPDGLSRAQKNIDPSLAQSLLLNGVIHCLPFLAKITQCQYDIKALTENDLLEAGVTNGSDRSAILDAFQTYREVDFSKGSSAPSAPLLSEEASAPPLEHINAINAGECVVCLDFECEVIFVPCGHLCCCCGCSKTIGSCPLCRASVERRITVTQL